MRRLILILITFCLLYSCGGNATFSPTVQGAGCTFPAIANNLLGKVWIGMLDCGMVGFSYAAGLGAKVAARERTVISLMGDGGFGMTMGEMTTAAMHDIGSIALVMDNGTWGSEIAYQRDFYDKRYIGAHVLSPRYDEVMKLCGGAGYYVTGAGETADALRAAMRDGKPTVIHAKVDPEAVVSLILAHELFK